MSIRTRQVLLVIGVALLLVWAVLTIVGVWVDDSRWAATGFVILVLAAVTTYASWTDR